MPGPIEQFERVCHIRHVHPQAQVGTALPEGSTPRTSGPQPGPSEPVDGLAEADVLLAAEALRSSRDVVVEPDRGTHRLSLASVMLHSGHH